MGSSDEVLLDEPKLLDDRLRNEVRAFIRDYRPKEMRGHNGYTYLTVRQNTALARHPANAAKAGHPLSRGTSI